MSENKKKIFDGIIKFRQDDFLDHKELFEELSNYQEPHSLFIGCSDSRVVPNMITNSLPGDLFIIRNIANLVPKYREVNEYLATTSAIEFAVQILNVENIIICGHSNCGGCASLFKPDSFFENIPNVKKWLEIANPVKEKVFAQLPELDMYEREWIIEQYNVAEQLNNLLTYPFIKERYDSGKIHLYGWYYIINTGEIFNFNLEKGVFELLN